MKVTTKKGQIKPKLANKAIFFIAQPNFAGIFAVEQKIAWKQKYCDILHVFFPWLLPITAYVNYCTVVWHPASYCNIF